MILRIWMWGPFLIIILEGGPAGRGGAKWSDRWGGRWVKSTPGLQGSGLVPIQRYVSITSFVISWNNRISIITAVYELNSIREL